jgi:hypothetical protein
MLFRTTILISNFNIFRQPTPTFLGGSLKDAVLNDGNIYGFNDNSVAKV